MSKTKLMNFRIPVKTSQRFKNSIDYNETDMTAVIVAFMEAYAVKHGEVVGDEPT